MLIKRLTAAFFIALACLATYCLVPRDSIHGIELGGTLYSGQSPIENFQYRRLVGNAINGDVNALAELVEFPTGGGASSYDHGAVLVHILMKVGDLKFSGMAQTLDKRKGTELEGLLGVGFEYGFPASVNDVESRRLYPLTAEAIANQK
jgi:hypothetical protein